MKYRNESRENDLFYLDGAVHGSREKPPPGDRQRRDTALVSQKRLGADHVVHTPNLQHKHYYYYYYLIISKKFKLLVHTNAPNTKVNTIHTLVLNLTPNPKWHFSVLQPVFISA